jgi:hypothetical protein
MPQAASEERIVSRAIGAAVVILVMTAAGSALAVDYGRAPRNDERSDARECASLHRQLQALLDKQSRNALSAYDHNRLANIRDIINPICSK